MFARTERLLLRPAWSEDAPALFAAIADEGIVRNLARAPWPYTLADAQAFVAGPQRAGEPAFLVFRVGAMPPALVGAVGLARAPGGCVELGYWIARPFWGHGFATEAARAVVAIARDGLRIDKLVAGHFLDNPASARVLRKLGFAPTGSVRSRFSAGRGEQAPCADFELAFGTAQAAGSPVEACGMLAA